MSEEGQIDITYVAHVNKGLERFVPPYGAVYHERGFVLEKGTVEPGKKSVWQLDAFSSYGMETAAIYFSCPRCTKISADMHCCPETCLVCNHCGRHLWLRYDGFLVHEANELIGKLTKKFKGRRR